MDTKKEDTLIKLTKEFWAHTYQTNIGKLIGICYRYTGNYQLSEDLTHDAFLKAIEKSQSFRGDGNFDAWLRRIVVNHVLQYLRNQKKNPHLQQLTSDQAATITAQENTSSIQSMEFTTIELLDTIDQLPEHHRLVFNLYVVEKFSHAQIGEELDISEGTSKSHLARARKKLQQLLTEKIEIQKEEGNKEKAAILLFALTDDATTDQMFLESFDQFSIPPKNPLSLDFPQRPGKDILKKISSKKSFQIIVASSAVIATTLFIFFNSKNTNHEETKMNNTVSVPMLTNKDSMINEENNENILPQPATISQDNVNTGRNKKLHSMKPLDSLALMLALSAGPVNASSLKDSIKNQIQKQSLEIATTVDSTLRRDQSKSVVISKIDSAERGSFRASELFWNKDNMEVEFKGNVRVNFKDQHFKGKGTFNFLGKVYLFIVDGQRVALGKTIKLSDQDYNLTVFDSAEAISKFGDLGKNGAILIYKSE